jgi:hypothetical protein
MVVESIGWGPRMFVGSIPPYDGLQGTLNRTNSLLTLNAICTAPNV